MDIDRLITNNDLNYIIGFIIIIYSAKFLNQHKKNTKKYNKYQNLVFLSAITIIAYHNLVLGAILSILYLSINV